MDQAGLIALGAVIAAAATGGVQAWNAWKQRLLDRRVAARAILSDLYLSESLLKTILSSRDWPDVVDIKRPLDTWHEFRAAFAASVTAAEWAQIDNLYANLHRLSLALSLGALTVDDAENFLDSLLTKVEGARAIALGHAAKMKTEQNEIKVVMESRAPRPVRNDDSAEAEEAPRADART